MAWSRLLPNRFTLTFGTIALVIFFWNLYVAANNDGILTGTVVGPDGAPVEGARLTLSEQTIVSLTPLDTTVTDAAGRFLFVRHDRHHVVLTAEKEGIGQSGRRYVRLHFRNQNRDLAEPLELAP